MVPRKDQWLSDETWDYIEKRKQAKLLLVPNCSAENCMFSNLIYQYYDKMVKMNSRKYKHNHLKKKAELAKEAARRGDSKTVYHLTNEIVKKCQGMEIPV